MKETGTDVTDQQIIEAMQVDIDALQAQLETAEGKVITIKSCYENESLEHDKTRAQLAAVRLVVNELDDDADELDVAGPIAEPPSKDNGWLHKYELAANATRSARDKLQAAIGEGS